MILNRCCRCIFAHTFTVITKAHITVYLSMYLHIAVDLCVSAVCCSDKNHHEGFKNFLVPTGPRLHPDWSKVSNFIG